jgi:hypothetical protein
VRAERSDESALINNKETSLRSALTCSFLAFLSQRERRLETAILPTTF